MSRPTRIVILGGGFAGVETAAQVNDFVRAAGRYYPRIAPAEVRVVRVHSGNRVLPEVSEKLSDYAVRQLGRAGVDVRLWSTWMIDGHRVNPLDADWDGRSGPG